MATTKLFKSGNSVAVRLPAAFAAKPGTPVEVREEAGVWVVAPVEPPHERIDLSALWAMMPGLRPFADDERKIEEREIDWECRRANG